MKVTVLVAAYNCEATLASALESAVSQSLPSSGYEVLVIDDGSRDRTGEIAGGFPAPVRVLREPHRGLAPTCNRGLAEARGEYLLRLDGDDRLDRDCLLMMSRVLDANARIGSVYSDRFEEQDGRLTRVDMGTFDVLKTIACGVMFRTDIARAVGGYDDLLFEEYDFLIRYLERAGATFYLPVPLYTYVRHGAGITAQDEYWRRGWEQLVAKWGIERLRAVGCTEGHLP